MNAPLKISRAERTDICRIKPLLMKSELPVSDISLKLQEFWVAKADDELIGAVALERYNENGIFRSFVVNEEYRNKKIGRALHKIVIAEARRYNLKSLYLLTTTAEKYFLKSGWINIDRTLVPEGIVKSQEFASICPQSAVCMEYKLEGPGGE